MYRLVCVVVVMLLQAADVYAIDKWFATHERGWFFYDDPEPIKEATEPVPQTQPQEPPKEEEKPVEEEQVKQLPLPPAPVEADTTNAGPPAGSVAWIRENLPVIRDRAIDNPTKENVRRFLYLHRLMMDKADDFQQQVIVQGKSDPQLDENNHRIMSPHNRQEMGTQRRRLKSGIIRQMAETHAFVFLYKSDDVLSNSMAVNLNDVVSNHNLDVTAVAVDGKPLSNGYFPDFIPDTGYSEVLGVNSFPALVMYDTDTKKWASISQNYLSVYDVEDRIVVIAYAEGLISKDAYEQTLDTMNRNLLTDKLPKAEDANKDDQEYVEFFKTLYAQ